MTNQSFDYIFAEPRLNVLLKLINEKDPAHFQSLDNIISLLAKDLQDILGTKVSILPHMRKIPFQIYDRKDTRHIRFAINDELDFTKILSTLSLTIVIACCTDCFISEEIDPYSFSVCDFKHSHTDLYSLTIRLYETILAKHKQ